MSASQFIRKCFKRIKRFLPFALLIIATVAITSLFTFFQQTEPKFAEGTNKPSQSAQKYPDWYQQVVERSELNAAFLPRLQFSTWREYSDREQSKSDLESRNDASIAIKESEQKQPGKKIELSQLQELWSPYLKDLSASKQLEKLGESKGTIALLDAPLDIQVHRTIKKTVAGIPYLIEVITWQALPGIYMPANLYRPAHPKEARLPVVLNPSACGEDVATHYDKSSPQRLMANLAVNGMISFVTEGFCSNGIFKDVAGNDSKYEYYSLLSGLSISTDSLTTILWQRALNWLESRKDTDMTRVGVTGYSQGSNQAEGIFSFNDRVAALADVRDLSAAVATDPQSNRASQTFTDKRIATTLYQARNHLFSAPFPTSSLPQPLETRLKTAEKQLATRWSELQIDLAGQYSAPRPVFFVFGRNDPFTQSELSQQAYQEMLPVWKDLKAKTLPSLTVVPGSHNFDADRRALVVQWLVRTLAAKPLLPLKGDREHETPILPREKLEVVPKGFPGTTLHDMFIQLADQAITEHRRQTPLQGLTQEDAKAALKNLLKLGKVHSESDLLPRPILIDETYIALPKDREVKFEYWLISLNEHLKAGVVLLTPSKKTVTADQVQLTIMTDSLIPSVDDVLKAMDRDEAIAAVLIPGYGLASSGQEGTGNLSRDLITNDDLPSLMGIGVESVKRTVDLLHSKWGSPEVTLQTMGIEPGSIAYFAIALDQRISRAEIHRGLASFTDLLKDPSQPVPPPSLLIPNLMTTVDVEDLRWLAQPRPLVIKSQAKAEDFAPYACLKAPCWHSPFSTACRTLNKIIIQDQGKLPE